MNSNQKGSSLVVALVLLAIITLVAVYSIEGSVTQSKMVASSQFSSLTYQECRNEQESSIRYYNQDGGTNREELLLAKDQGYSISFDSTDSANLPFTYQNATSSIKSDMTSTWSYIGLKPSSRSGSEVEQSSASQAFLFQNNCISNFRFSTNNQTLGVSVDGLISGQDVH